MDANMKIPQEFEYLKPYIPLMENSLSGLNGEVSLVDLVKLYMDKDVLIGDSEGLEYDSTKAIVVLPTKGKYVDLAPLREALRQLHNISLHEIVVFVNEYPFESDMSHIELIKLIVNNFRNDHIKTN